MMHRTEVGPSTLAVHAGHSPDPRFPGASTPIYQSSTFAVGPHVYDSFSNIGKLRKQHFYTRLNNPSLQAAADKLSALEGAEDALLFASGMGAISATLRALIKPGSIVVAARTLYGASDGWLEGELPLLQVSVRRVDILDLEAVSVALEGASMLFFEPLSNPLVEAADVPALVALAKARGALTVVDNTFLTPYNFRPLEHGVDVVIHSATKYLNGHSDIIAGAVCGSNILLDRIWTKLIGEGACMDPHSAFLLERGMKTLALRMARHNENAAAITDWLVNRPEVERVFYPTHQASPGYGVAHRLFRPGFGGVCSFVPRGGLVAARKFVAYFEKTADIFLVGASLGGVESLIGLPSLTSHASPATQKRMGLPEGLIRVCCGIEDSPDLENALARAFAA